MTTETINGLHKCQPKNEPQTGQVKTFQVIHNPAKNGKKAWIKIKSAPEDKGGAPYRVVSVEPTGWEPDDYGNVSYNIEIEPAVGGGGGENTQKPVQAAPSSSQYPHDARYDTPEKAARNAPQAPPARPNGEDGVQVTREHLMRSANLYILCVNAANKAVAPHMPEIAQTSEQFGAIVGQLFREAYTKRTDDGVNWYSYVDKMPTKPIVK